ncbi:MAG TPA: signal peptide peptidase SppA [Myxococcaceae bacterium]|nr:signal peptide peptidase SppA [Myxococcaceae bacterium]
MMRALGVGLWNLLTAASLLVRVPLRWALARPAPPYVRFELQGDPPYRPPPRRWLPRRAPHGRVAALDAFRRRLEELGADRRVRGIVLEVGRLEMAPAKRLLVARWLRAFRARNKEVVGFAVSPGNAEYALLCEASRVVLPRPGRLALDGFLLEATALGQALERLGVRPEFVRRGEFKTAPELFTRSDISPNQQMLLDSLLDDRHGELVEAVSAGRRLEPDQARLRVDEGPYSAERALAAGLVDALADEAELPSLLGLPDPGRGDARVPDFDSYRRSRRLPVVRWGKLRTRPRLAVVPVAGIIAEGEGLPARPGPAVAGSESLLPGLRAAGEDRRCPAVLLYVNSPGGSALASERVADEVARLARRKPVIAYTDRVAASGGYLLSLGAKELWAGPHAVIGSIGVFAGKFDLSLLLERLGIRRTAYTRGAHAGLGTLARPMTDAERGALEREVEEMYRRFLDRVGESRKLDAQAVLARAEGRVFTAGRALAEGLLDRLGTFEEAVARALELAGLAGPDGGLVVHGLPRRRLGLASLVPRRAQVLALWWPWISGEGLSGHEAFGGER